MNNKNNLEINQIPERKKKYNSKLFFKILYAQIRYNRWKSTIFTIATILLLYCILNYKNFNCEIEFITNNIIISTINKIFKLDISSNILILVFSMIIYAVLIIFLGIPIGAKEKEENCSKAGIVNHLQQSPIFIRKYINKLNKKVIIYEFFANATSYTEQWLKFQDKLEDSFDDYYIKGIKKNGKRIFVYLTKEEINYSKPLYYKSKTIQEDEKYFKVPIGVNQFDEKVYWNISLIPHSLVGGETNSGKTVTEKFIIAYCLQHNCDVLLFDFKGGVDYNNPIWKENGLEIYTTIDDLIIQLEKAVDRLEETIRVFNKFRCSTFEQFKKKAHWSQRKRLLLVFDEAAEFLDKDRYITKEEKEKFKRIVNALNTLASRSRAFGINLCTITQSPSADIIPKFLRRNSGFRICFRADNILSNIVLDNDNADKLIPKNSQGLCVTNQNELVKCYYAENDEDYFK